MTITLLLLLASFIVSIASAIGKAPLWVAVVLLTLALLLGHLPIR